MSQEVLFGAFSLDRYANRFASRADVLEDFACFFVGYLSVPAYILGIRSVCDHFEVVV
jgi:hypothetical protein